MEEMEGINKLTERKSSVAPLKSIECWGQGF